jgi:hypothetical protein
MNDVNISGCKFSADIVPYMYGEMSAAESSAFETHLIDCGVCTDEFAAVSNARFEVYDWKKTEFDPLETPVFEVPFGDRAVTTAASWLDKLRAAFANSWAVPGVAFAGIAIVSVFTGVFYFSGESGPEVAQENSNSRPTVVSPQREPEVGSVPSTNDDLPRDEPRPVQATVVSTPQKRTVRNAKAVVNTRPVEARSTTTANRTAPRLNEFSEDEDTSLRLAQLFDDVDTRD